MAEISQRYLRNKRERFKNEAIETYWIFNEIAEALEQSQRTVHNKGRANRSN
jgi:hypothetical protein